MRRVIWLALITGAMQAQTYTYPALAAHYAAPSGRWLNVTIVAHVVTAGADIGTAAATGGGFADVLAAAVAWIICTELRRQGRMPARTYYLAAPEFAAYSERGKRGYYVWAIPSTRHLRAHPQSWYSRLLERTFNCRARYIANRKRGLPGTLAGALVTHGLYGFCWMLSWFVPASFARWQTLYRT